MPQSLPKSPYYDHKKLEEKWLQVWEHEKLFLTSEQQEVKDKMYLLFAFPYPSGSGLHVGHAESKTALDIMARFYRMNGKQVFFPIGWDAFGLPAENYAIKTGIPPVETTKTAIDTFRRQIKRLAISYDWANELATCHPGYYKWTQWLFLQLYNKELAYQKEAPVNWCPSCQTVLANEQVVDGKCERCGTEVIQKEMKQWFFKIKQYQDELISGLDEVDWPKPTKDQQLHWIGKKSGINIEYEIDGSNEKITCFTTRPDTNFGATFLVIAPEHPFAQKVSQESTEIEDYIKSAQGKTELERQQDGKKKTGVFTGYHAINNLNDKKMPIWISDFVLSGFGTGAVVGVPGHDKRDFEFARAFDLEVIRVVVAPDGDTSEITTLDQVQEDEGEMINSEFLDGMEIHQAKEKMIDYLEKKGWGKRVTTYRLRDWLISRQRYWGAPIPIVYDPQGKAHPVKEEHLPWKLPEDVDFNPTGVSPLASSKELFARTEKLYGKGWTPEVDTMDTFVDSSWYYLRYVASRNEEQFSDPQKMKDWLPVDFYMIGPEHIVLHLLYSRFFTKFLRDEGYISFGEPFKMMRHQGMILGPDNRKMSKSKGNVINPDDVVDKFGADTLRMYEMFMGPIEADKPWNTNAVAGIYRFLNRVDKLVESEFERLDNSQDPTANNDVRRKYHQVLEKVSQDIPNYKFNTAIAAMMELVNIWETTAGKPARLTKEECVGCVKLLAPFAPFLAEELFQKHAAETKTFSSVHQQSWPVFDSMLAEEDTVKIAIQVNGKLRGEIQIPVEQLKDKQIVLNAAKELEIVAGYLRNNEIVKEIYVPGKILNFVVKN